MSNVSEGKTETRKYYIDNIRWVTVCLVILYHVIYMFNSVGVISNIGVTGIREMDAVLYFIYPWFMCLLFVVGGMSARYSLQKRSKKAFVKERIKRLLVPSVAGIFILGWVSGWITSQYTDMFEGNGDLIPGAVKYIIYCIFGFGPLWFAHELFLASMVLLLICAVDKKDKLYELGGRVNFIWLCLLVVAVWGSAQILNTPLFEVYRNGIYIFMFLLGYYVFSHESVTDCLAKYSIWLLPLSVIGGVAYTIFFFGQNYASQVCLRHPFTNLYAWFMILALLGLFKARFQKTNRFAAYMTERNFGFYVLHYPLMCVIAYVITTYLSLPMPAVYVVLLIAEIVLLPLCYELVSRIPGLRFLLLGKTKSDKNQCEVKN